MDLADIRQAIDGIDTTLLNSFVERMDIATEVAKSKIEMGKAVFDPARERSKLNNLAGRAPERYEAQTITLFRLLMSMSKALDDLLDSIDDVCESFTYFGSYTEVL